jgi:hypothetical protein
VNERDAVAFCLNQVERRLPSALTNARKSAILRPLERIVFVAVRGRSPFRAVAYYRLFRQLLSSVH